MSKISVVGLDLAKNVFQIHGVDEAEEVVLRKQLKRSQMQPFSLGYRPVWSAWKPVAAPSTGLGYSPSWGIPSG